jgi:hypothetical protein
MSATFRLTWTATVSRLSSFLVKVRASDALLLAESTLDQIVSPYGDITYPSGLVFALGVAKTSTPVIAGGGGVPDLWTISPATLPVGLSFNAQTGTISGTGTVDSVQLKTITASNAAGSDSGAFSIVVKPALVAVTQTIVQESGPFRNYNMGTGDDIRPKYIQLTFSDPIRLADDVYSKVIGPVHNNTQPAAPYGTKTVSGNKLIDLRDLSSGLRKAIIVSGHFTAKNQFSTSPPPPHSNNQPFVLFGTENYLGQQIPIYEPLPSVQLDLGQYYTQLTVAVFLDDYEYIDRPTRTFNILQGFGIDQYGRPTAATAAARVVAVGVDA